MNGTRRADYGLTMSGVRWRTMAPRRLVFSMFFVNRIKRYIVARVGR